MSLSDNLKSALVFWGSFILLGVLLGGAMTGFKFNELDIQLHDTYFTIPIIYVIIFIIIILWILRGVFLLIEIGTSKSKSFAIIVAIVNMFFILPLMTITYLSVVKLWSAKQDYPDLNVSGYVGLISGIFGLACLLILIEFNTIKKVRT